MDTRELIEIVWAIVVFIAAVIVIIGRFVK